ARGRHASPRTTRKSSAVRRARRDRGMKAASIEFEGVTKRYGDVAAVRDLSVVMAAGTLTTLLGPSGCGKTTTLRLIAGLELPNEGVIRIGGRDVSNVPASERDVSMVFQ